MTAEASRPGRDAAIGERDVVLIGLMGSGKSTVGRLLADRLGRRFDDSDARIEASTGRTVKQIRAEDGVGAMRSLEAAALFDALSDDEPLVIAAAAGVVVESSHRERLAGASAFVVWLDGSPERLATRAAGGEHRPFLDTDPIGTLRDMNAERAGWYRELADLVVAVDDLTPAQIADRIVDRVVR